MKALKAPSMGKGSQIQVLPSRNALNLLTKGDPVQRSLGNYAKSSPADVSGVGQIGQPNFVSGIPNGV